MRFYSCDPADRGFRAGKYPWFRSYGSIGAFLVSGIHHRDLSFRRGGARLADGKEQLGFPRHICELFEKAGAFVGDETKSVADKRQMVKEMAQFAHEENAEWQDIRRNAKPEPML